MVIDTSAIIAVIFNEPEREEFIDVVDNEPITVSSAIAYYETSIVAVGKLRDRRAIQLVDEFMSEFMIEVIACDADQARAAREAYLKFGRGWHAAGLNFADCCSYALAQTRHEPLLFKGGDFLLTDVVPAFRKA